MDVINSLDTLFPPFREQAEKYAEQAKTLNFYLYETYRSFERQFELYQKGRQQQNGIWVVTDKSLIVTNAKPGSSFHAYGLAFDSIPDGNNQKQGIQWSWEDYDLTKEGIQLIPWDKAAKIGKNLGLEWAGDWKTFKEMPHFQNTFGFKISELYPILTSDGIESVWKLIYEKIKPTETMTPVTVEIPKPTPIPIATAEGLDRISDTVEKEKQDASVISLVMQIIKVILSMFSKK